MTQDGDPNRYEVFKAGWNAACFSGHLAAAVQALSQASKCAAVVTPEDRAKLMIDIAAGYARLAAIERNLYLPHDNERGTG